MKEFISIIENKNTDTNTNKSKNAAWLKVTQRFNELNNKERSSMEVKQQWRTMKLEAKKNVSAYRRLLNGTGGGPKPPSPGPETNGILELIPQEFEVDSNSFDSDGIGMQTQDSSSVLSQINVTSEPILITIKDNSINNKQEIITTPVQSKAYESSTIISSLKEKSRKRKLSFHEHDNLAKDRNEVLIRCMKEEHELKIKHMTETHNLTMEESRLRIKILELDLLSKSNIKN